jgi:type I protein arginine methyltransferase
LWWSAELVEGVSLATGPLDPKTHWEQLYLPALAPIAIGAGQTLGVRLRSTTSYERGTNVAWTLTVKDASGRDVLRQALDLEKGFLP